jgi:NitT/TauT family transport system substrate-binding protein
MPRLVKSRLTKTLLAVGTSVLSLAGSLAASDAAELKHVTVVLSYIPNVENFGPIYAKEKGFFKDAGLDVEIVPGGSGIDGLQMISSGTAQIAMMAAENVITAESRGEHLKVIGARFQKNPQAMTCRQDSGITDAHMIKGKRLAIKQTAIRQADVFLAKLGLTTADMQTLSVGGSDISSIIAGRVDCLYSTFAFNEPRLLAKAGVPVNVLPLGDYGLNSQPGAMTVTEKYFKENKEVLTAYLTAESHAWADYFKDPDAAAKFMVEGGFNDGLDLDQQTFQAEHQGAFMTSALTKEKGILYLDPSVWKETAANAFAAKTTPNLVDPSDLLTTEILDKVDRPKL